MGLPYRAILTIACLVLAVRLVVFEDVSPRTRWIVGLVTATTLVLPASLAWSIAGVIGQLSISLFVLLRAVANRT